MSPYSQRSAQWQSRPPQLLLGQDMASTHVTGMQCSLCSHLAPEYSQPQRLSLTSTTAEKYYAVLYTTSPNSYLQPSLPHTSIASPWYHMSSGWNPGPCSFSSAQICPDLCQWAALLPVWQSAPIAAYLLSAGLNFHHWHPLLRTQWWQAHAVTVHMCYRVNAFFFSKFQRYFSQI